jgi:predicted signal transduction protein with EAL and GGDEF domain
MFQRLQTKLTVLYAGLFGAAMVLVSVAVYAAVKANAEGMVRTELEAGGAVFDRLWALRSDQLHEGAGLLARDFGFRAAMADGDAATIGSAVDNLKARLGVDRAFVIGADGTVISGSPKAAESVADALVNDDQAAGVVLIQGAPYQAVSAPILSPNLTGWVVFASRLDQAEMTSLARLSAIPLDAAVLHKQGSRWLGGQASSTSERAAVNRFIEGHLAPQDAKAADLTGAGPSAVALVKPLKVMDAQAPAVLVLRYPLERAMAPYRPLLAAILAVGLLGLIALAWGSWALARTLTRPITVLDDAARRLQAGEDVEVHLSTKDEVGRLASRFNAMAQAIRVRERRITQLALNDAETELPNRLALEQAVERMAADNDLVAVAAIGVERFSHIRGAIGYGLSSALMGELGRRLQALAPQAVVARISSDTLGIVAPAASLDEAESFVTGLRHALEEPVELGEATIDVAVTTGLAAWPEHAPSAATVVDKANIGLDQARAQSRKAARFDEALYGDPAANLSLMSEMLEAIRTGGLHVYYQPKFDLRRSKVTALEALVRWPHPRRGNLPPDLFVAMAEETGHIRQLTDFVLAKAIADQKALLAFGHDMAISVNLSGRLVGDDDFTASALAQAAARSGKLCLELTETAVIDNPDAALAQLDRFAAAGIEISIDDYGSGLSSLAYLKQIKASELKIDKAFVTDMAQSQRDALLIRSTIDLAHGLGMKVVAEGVEEETAAALLSGMGCDFAQGYFIAKPAPLKELLSILDQINGAEQIAAAQGGVSDPIDADGSGRRVSRRTGLRTA